MAVLHVPCLGEHELFHRLLKDYQVVRVSTTYHVYLRTPSDPHFANLEKRAHLFSI